MKTIDEIASAIKWEQISQFVRFWSLQECKKHRRKPSVARGDNTGIRKCGKYLYFMAVDIYTADTDGKFPVQLILEIPHENVWGAINVAYGETPYEASLKMQRLVKLIEKGA